MIGKLRVPNDINDPLKIYYFLILKEASFEEYTPFQAFSPGWEDLLWTAPLLAMLPADVSEPSIRAEDLRAQRIGGMRFVNILPLNIDALEKIEDVNGLGLFTVFISSHDETNTRVKNILKQQNRDIFHISVPSRKSSYEFELYNLRDHFLRVLNSRENELDQKRKDFAEDSLNSWRELEPEASNHEPYGHNIFMPNQLVLERSGLNTTSIKRWMGQNESEYTNEVIKSAKCVSQLRDDTGLREFNRVYLPTPEIILTEPSFGRMHYKQRPFNLGRDDVALSKAMRRLQTQRGLHQTISKTDMELFFKTPIAQTLVNIRQKELAIYTMGVSLRAASDCSAVMRMSPGVNHVFGKLKTFASNIRSTRPEAKRKSKRLFMSIQDDLVKAVGPERIEYIKERGGSIKIVSDAPIEWLPVDGLPLSLRYDCSRINATPGNMMMGSLLETARTVVSPDDLKRILIVSAFEDDDPLRNMMKLAMESFFEGKDHGLNIDFVRVNNVTEFTNAINQFDGGVMVFDGHGSGNAFDPISHLVIGGEKIDIWSLRGKVRIPPIVLLSACDTHSLDGTTHATVANGFLMLGARTVLATFLPINGLSAAAFVARMLLRIDEFLDAVMNLGWRALTWTEVVSGMLRMQYQSEIFDYVFGPITSEVRKDRAVFDLQSEGNHIINFGNLDWYEQIVTKIAEFTEKPYHEIIRKAEAALSRSETIRYVQLGNPETIVIAREDLIEEAMKDYQLD